MPLRGGGVDTGMETMDTKNRSLNTTQTNNSTSDTVSKMCIKFLNYGGYF